MGKPLSMDITNYTARDQQGNGRTARDGYYDGRMGREMRSGSAEYRREYERGLEVHKAEVARLNEQKGRSDEYITTTGRF